MARSRLKAKGRRSSGRFVLVPLCVLDSPTYAGLSYQARALLFEVAGQYAGKNNGDLSAAPAIHASRGWPRNTLQRATIELEAAGFIVRTRQGGRNACNLYAVTWQPIDECHGKNLDHGFPMDGRPLRLWEKSLAPVRG